MAEPFWVLLFSLSFVGNILLLGYIRWKNARKLPDWVYTHLKLPRPVVRTKDKVLAVMDEGERKGCLKSTERKLVENIFKFKDRTAEDVMIHRRDVVMISMGESHEEIMNRIVQTGLSRFPVYAEGTDDVVGILATRKYLLSHLSTPRKTVEELIYPAYFVPTTVGAEGLLRDMQNRKTHIAIVVDEYGGVDGIVTLEDLLEEIVGNIYDEFDPLAQENIIQISENRWRVAGGAELSEVATVTGISLPQEEFDTMGGLIYDQLDMIPEDGHCPSIEIYGMSIQVEHMVDRRILWVSMTVLQSVGETL